MTATPSRSPVDLQDPWFRLARLPLVWIEADLVPEEEERLPARSGLLLRRALRDGLRELACPAVTGGCDPATSRHTCVYGQLCEPQDTGVAPYLDAASRAPLPYVLKLAAPVPADSGGSYRLGLVLMGPAIPAAAMFVDTLERIGARGLGEERARYQLRNHSVLGAGGQRRPVARQALFDEPLEPANGRTPPEPVPALPPDARGLRVSTITPFVLPRVQPGGAEESLTFGALFRALLVRTDRLCQLHGEGNLEVDREALEEQADRVVPASTTEAPVDWRFPGRKRGRRPRWHGVNGSWSFGPDALPFAPLLGLGQALQVGRGTVLGLGEYRVEPV